MKLEGNAEKKEPKEDVVVYITFNGIPLFTLPYKREDDNSVLMSSFLHTIDIVAEETRKKIGRSADFYGFDLINNIQVEVIEVVNKHLESKNKVRLFIQTPYGKTPINRTPIIALLGATHDIISRIKNKEVNLIYKRDTSLFFTQYLEEKGYTTDRILKHLGHLTLSQTHFSNYLPISLYSIEREGKNPEKYALKPVGSYNGSHYKKNPIKTESGTLTFNSSLMISLAEVLKSYQSATSIKCDSIVLRYRDFSLGVYYKNHSLPYLSVFIKGKGSIEEMKRFHDDLGKLKLEHIE